jgi:peptidyl-prolyl cis-trans isomerase SurA
MNKLFFSVRCVLMAWVWGAVGLLGGPAWLQAQTLNPSAGNRQADFIVAVVNSEPVTNSEIQALRQRLTKEAASRGDRSPDVSELNRLALDQLIHEKAQLQQAREAGIKIDSETLDQAELNLASSNQVTREEMHKRLLEDGIQLSSFREQLRTQLTLKRLREREIEGRVRVSDQEVEQFLRDQLKVQAAQLSGELNLGMILIVVPENSREPDTQALSDRAAEIARRARSGENFAELAKAFSQTADRGGNGGEMGLRSTDRYPDLFLEATRLLNVGEVAAPVRSAAGFHVLKVLERRQPTTLLVTQTRARHILLRPSAQLSVAQATTQLGEVRQAVVSGKADFAAMARQMSQDGSAQQGGDLGWANPGMFVREFEQVMNRLRPGQVAEPLVSRFGVHLIEVTDRRNVPMSDQEQRTVARNALREKKFDETYAAWVEDIRGRAYVEMRESPQ